MKNGFHLMTWKEISDAIDRDPVVIVPLGSMEQHGPHSITGDYLVCEKIAKIAAKKTNSYYIPVIPFGYSEYFRCYPGTISFSQQTIYAVLSDIFESLTEHGIEKILVLNGHGGNDLIIEGVARDLLRNKGIAVGKVDLWRLISPNCKEILYGKKKEFLGHGGDPVTSVMLFLFEEYMRMDLFSETEIREKWENFEIGRNLNSKIGDCEGTVYFDMNEVTKDGMQGDPSVSSKEKGKILFEEILSNCITFIEKMKKTNTVRKKR